MLPGNVENYEEEGASLLAFLKDWCIHNSWAVRGYSRVIWTILSLLYSKIERVIIAVENSEEKAFYEQLVSELWFSSQDKIHDELPTLEEESLETHLGPTNSCNWGEINGNNEFSLILYQLLEIG